MPAELVETKEDERDHDLELALLTALMIKWYGTMLKAMHTITIRFFNLGPIPLDDPAVRQMVLKARAAAVAVDATTQRLIAKRIADGLERGLTAREIAFGADDFVGLDDLFDQTWKNRPLTIAQTELQKAQVSASVNRFRQLGRGVVTHLLISDGDYDQPCADRNGRIVPIGQEPSLNHPNCRLSVSPIISFDL